MLRAALIIFVSSFFYTSLISQSFVLPHLGKNSKYGLVNKRGKKILPNEFDELSYYKNNSLIFCRKGKFWGVYNYNGEQLIGHFFEDQKPYIWGRISHGARYLDDNGNFRRPEISNLIMIKDATKNECYYINPNHPRSNIKSYKAKRLTSDHPKYQFSNNFELENLDGSIVFIDSTGVEILSSLRKISATNNNIWIQLGDNNRYALYNRSKQISKYKYLGAEFVKEGIVKAIMRKGVSAASMSSNYYPSDDLYEIINENAEVLYSNINNLESTNDTYVLIDSTRTLILDKESLEVINSFKRANRLIVFKDKLFDLSENELSIIGKENQKQTINQISNHTLLKNAILVFQKPSSSKEFGGYFFDDDLNELAYFENLQNVVAYKDSTYYMTYALYDKYSIKGIVNGKGQVLEEMKWKKLNVISENKNLIYVESDYIQGIKRIGSNEMILKKKIKNAEFIHCDKDKFRFVDSSSVLFYNYEGALLDSMSLEDFRNSPESKSKYRKKRVDGSFRLIDGNGEFIEGIEHKEITTIFNAKTKNSIYICRDKFNHAPAYVIYNDDLKNVVPPGFYYQQSYLHALKTGKVDINVILLYKEQQGEPILSELEMGVMDFSGNWLVEPRKGYVHSSGNDLFLYVNSSKDKYEFYDFDFEKVSPLSFDIVSNTSSNGNNLNRILVGNIIDRKVFIQKIREYKKEFVHRFKDIIYETDEFSIDQYEKYVSRVEGLPVKYGYLNSNFDISLPIEYNKATNFFKDSENAFVVKSDGGIMLGQEIDTNGVVLFQYEADDLLRLDDTHYKVKRKNKWAIVNDQGKLNTEFEFDEISYYQDYGLYKTIQGDSLLILNKKFRSTYIGHKDYIGINNTNRNNVKDYIIFSQSIKKKQHYKLGPKNLKIYDLSGKFIAELNDVDLADKYDLPKRYIVVKKYMNEESYLVVFDLKKKKYLSDLKFN